MYHSDIKPANIMMDEYHNMFLIDTDSFHQDAYGENTTSLFYFPFI